MTNDIHCPDSFTLIAYDCVDSTNEEAKRLVKQGATHGTVIWAKKQQAGRGRRGRQWISEPGNLFCSFIIKPECTLAEVSQLSFVMAISVTDALQKIQGAARNSPLIQCKWPNDILIRSKKTAGILLEMVIGSQNQLEGVVAGVGINIEHFPDKTDFPATSLKAEGIKGVTVSSVLEELCVQFSKWNEVWQHDGFQAIRSAWLEKAFGLGMPISVRLPSETHSGVFEALDPNGCLILNENGARRHIAAGDVYFDDAAQQRAV